MSAICIQSVPYGLTDLAEPCVTGQKYRQGRGKGRGRATGRGKGGGGKARGFNRSRRKDGLRRTVCVKYVVSQHVSRTHVHTS
jgi:hypothetical protein